MLRNYKLIETTEFHKPRIEKTIPSRNQALIVEINQKPTDFTQETKGKHHFSDK